ncbi:MAG: hypothetical protein ACPGUV_12370 [Polyangiales bacterium]
MTEEKVSNDTELQIGTLDQGGTPRPIVVVISPETVTKMQDQIGKIHHFQRGDDGGKSFYSVQEEVGEPFFCFTGFMQFNVKVDGSRRQSICVPPSVPQEEDLGIQSVVQMSISLALSNDYVEENFQERINPIEVQDDAGIDEFRLRYNRAFSSDRAKFEWALESLELEELLAYGDLSDGPLRLHFAGNPAASGLWKLSSTFSNEYTLTTTRSQFGSVELKNNLCSLSKDKKMIVCTSDYLDSNSPCDDARGICWRVVQGAEHGDPSIPVRPSEGWRCWPGYASLARESMAVAVEEPPANNIVPLRR